VLQLTSQSGEGLNSYSFRSLWIALCPFVYGFWPLLEWHTKFEFG